MPSAHPSPLRSRLYEVVFEARSSGGRAFDVALLVAILASVLVVVLNTVPGIPDEMERVLFLAEWGFTLLFTAEYALRLWIVARPRKYATSFFGVVDLVAILPTYLSLLFPGAQVLLVVRMVRLVRVFHVLNLREYEDAANRLLAALRATRFPLAVFFSALVVITVFLGSIMYLVEGPESGFTSIATGIYWAAVTVTTLGYGDLVPTTSVGRGITTLAVALSYWVLAVPVAVVSVELSRASLGGPGPGDPAAGEDEDACPACGAEVRFPDARFCSRCGSDLPAR